MSRGKRSFDLRIILLLVAAWIGCSPDKQLTGPAESVQVSLNIQFDQSLAKQSYPDMNNASQIIREVTVSVLEAGSNTVVIKEQQLEINSTPEGRFAEGELSIPVRDESQSFNIVVFAGDPDDLLFFVGTSNVTLEPGETGRQVDIFLGLPTSIAAAGTVTASSTFAQEGFEPGSAVDFNTGTSWFSGGANADGATSTFTWTARQPVFLGTIGIFNNERHFNPAYQTGFGFETITVQVFSGPDATGTMLYEETVDYPQSFPVVRVSPFLSGQSIRLLLNNHQDPTCGGFSELLIVALDLSTGEPLRTLTSISVTPLNPTINVAQTVQFKATGLYSDQTSNDITNDVAWQVNNTNFALINALGLATAVAAGTVQVTATQGTITGQTNLTVTAIPLTPPTISNIRFSLIELNSSRCSFQDPLGSLFDFSMDYTDPDGDVTDSTDVNYSFTFNPSGNTGSNSFPASSITGDGASGVLTLSLCIVFGTNLSLDQSFSITDAGGETSNVLNISIDKPTGGNSPPDGNKTNSRTFESIAVPDKKFN